MQLLNNFPGLTEAECLLLHSQEPSIGPYSESDQFSPYHPIHLSKIDLNIIHPPMS
jgi:hypothetical protein